MSVGSLFNLVGSAVWSETVCRDVPEPMALIWRCPVCQRIHAAAVEHTDHEGKQPEVERLAINRVQVDAWCNCAKEGR